MNLFSPFALRGVTLRNRVVVSPMCQYSSTYGFAQDWHLVHLGQFAVGGAGLVFTEATAVTPEGRISPQDLGLWKDEHIEMLARIAHFVRGQGAEMGVQLAHAGQKASTRPPWEGGGPVTQSEGGWSPIFAPSALPFADGYQVPVSMSQEDITCAVAAFRDGAVRALAAGMRVVELHAAHGYLMHSFLSPLSNIRNDRYGGNFENRARFVVEVVDAVRSVWPEELPLFLRLSVTDWRPDGWTVEDSIALARLLGPRGVDLVDCSSGGVVPKVEIPVGPGYQVELARRLRADARIPTGAVGMITAPEQADTIVRSGQADVVLLAREMLRNPHWPLLAAKAVRGDIRWPVQYERAKT
jgi:2,4-dienoyl-CoA reductase-like NADH-dependent reductase (Old Yellow Enzyme family)